MGARTAKRGRVPNKEIGLWRADDASNAVTRKEYVGSPCTKDSVPIRVHLEEILKLVHSCHFGFVISYSSILLAVGRFFEQGLRLLPLEPILSVEVKPMRWQVFTARTTAIRTS